MRTDRREEAKRKQVQEREGGGTKSQERTKRTQGPNGRNEKLREGSP